jgi:cation diffusion facilitator family transporter
MQIFVFEGHMASSPKAIYYALAANTGIAVTKSIAAFFTGSTSMTAEAIHSFADCGNQILLLFGMKRSAAPASELHPLGYGKVSYFWSFMVALMLFSVGGVFSVYEGSHKLLHPQAVEKPWIAVGVLFIGVILESFSLAGALGEIKDTRGNRSLYRWFKDTRQSELMVVVGEDIAALLGLAIALLFVFLTLVTGNPLFDAAGSIAIGLLLITIATMMTLEIKSLIIGESADDEFKSTLTSFVSANYPQVELLNLITQHHGRDIVLAIKARFKKWPSSARAMVDQINEIEAAIRSEFGAVRFIFFEPDISSEEEKRAAVKKKRALKKK